MSSPVIAIKEDNDYYCTKSCKTMHVLLNQAKEAIAYIETNMIVAAHNLELAGVLLGNLVFDRSGKLAGKFFGGIVYNLKGEQLAASKIAESAGEEVPFHKHLQEASDIVYSIKNHADVWIEPTEKWGKTTLLEELNKALILA